MTIDQEPIDHDARNRQRSGRYFRNAAGALKNVSAKDFISLATIIGSIYAGHTGTTTQLNETNNKIVVLTAKVDNLSVKTADLQTKTTDLQSEVSKLPTFANALTLLQDRFDFYLNRPLPIPIPPARDKQK